MKTLVFKKVGSMMIVASLLMLLSSCHENSKRLFPSKLKDSYLITYSKNEIVVESDDDATHFIYKKMMFVYKGTKRFVRLPTFL